MNTKSEGQRVDVDRWVEQAPTENEGDFRKAVHIILHTLATTTPSGCRFALKGGILLAIRYEGSRFTTDVDFSTSDTYSQTHVDNLLDRLNSEIPLVIENLGYGIACRIQGHKVHPRPDQEERDFFTLQIRLGFARQGSTQHQKLLAGRASRIIKVDYSFYERMPNLEVLELGNNLLLPAYSIHDLAAEKIRALIQQVTRYRTRRQDAFDLYGLLRRGHLQETQDREVVLASLIEKAASRGLRISRQTIDSPEIRNRSAREYGELQAEISGELPEFEDVFDVVQSFYRSLPWPDE